MEHALDTVRQLANRPRPLVDNHTLLAALEQLSDVARESRHAEKKVRCHLPPVQAACKGSAPRFGGYTFIG